MAAASKSTSRATLEAVAPGKPFMPRPRNAQFETSANLIQRELAPSLGDCGMALNDWELEAFSRAVASGSALAQDTVLRLVALRVHYEVMGLGEPDLTDDLLEGDPHGRGPVF